MVIRGFVLAVLVILVGSSIVHADTRVCNTGDTKIFLAYAYDTDVLQVQGWFPLSPGQCRTESFAYYLAIAQLDKQGRAGLADYRPGWMDAPVFNSDNRTFCVDPDHAFARTPVVASSCLQNEQRAQFRIYAEQDDSIFTHTLKIDSNENVAIQPFGGSSAGAADNAPSGDSKGPTAEQFGEFLKLLAKKGKQLEEQSK